MQVGLLEDWDFTSVSKKQYNILFFLLLCLFLFEVSLNALNASTLEGEYQFFYQAQTLVTEKIPDEGDRGRDWIPKFPQLKLSHECLLMEPQYSCQFMYEFNQIIFCDITDVHIVRIAESVLYFLQGVNCPVRDVEEPILQVL